MKTKTINIKYFTLII